MNVLNIFFCRNHVRLHKVDAKFTCQHCPAKFSSKRTLRNHEKEHIADEEKEFQCDMCQEKFAMKGRLSWHRRQACKSRPAVPLEDRRCKFCSNTFTTISGHRQHERRCKNNPDPPPMLECPLPHCTKTFARQDNLTEHLRHHQGGGTNPCKKGCGQTFDSRASRIRHEKSCDA